jgi:MinD-like ATPase involved in chromosome partitioning or flagellar assembly
VEDENADRVYVPGTNPTPPARDVEPFWPPEELAAPVHGGKPVPHEASPGTPVPPPSIPSPGVPVPPPEVYRAEALPPQPLPPPQHVPPQPSQPQSGPPQSGPPQSGPPQSGPARVANGVAPVSGSATVNGSARPGPISGAPSAASAATDSPWAQPPNRPAPSDGRDDVEPRREQAAGRANYYPTVTPRRVPEDTEPPHAGTVYRPGPVVPGQDRTAPGPDGTAPVRPVPQGSGPVRPAPGAGQPGHGGPGPARPGGQFPPDQRPGNGPYQGPPPHAGPPVPPGPYPPSVDPRATQAHPPVQHGPTPGPTTQAPPIDPYHNVPWVSDGTPTAEEFARRRQAKPAEPTATMGARAMLRKSTMGLVKLAPGKHEMEFKRDVEMVRRNFGGLRQVTVVNPKGGAGKTVAVLLLAMTFGQKRGGYVLAWDNNETQGTLGMRAQQDFHARTVRDMMRDLHLFRGSHGRVGDLSQYVRAQGEGMFDVLASDESATAGEMLTASAFAEIREIVSRFYKLIFVDTGNNVRAQNWQAAMDATDQLVITMSARNDSAETAARMLDHLEQSGRQRLVRQAVSVVSMPPTRKDIDLPAIQRHFAARTRAVLLAPYEKLIDSGEPLRYGHLSNQTRDAWLKIAAAVAEGL